jgi:hypothetical protein
MTSFSEVGRRAMPIRAERFVIDGSSFTRRDDVTILRVGATKKYASNWSQAFGGGNTEAETATAEAAKKNSTAQAGTKAAAAPKKKAAAKKAGSAAAGKKKNAAKKK